MLLPMTVEKKDDNSTILHQSTLPIDQLPNNYNSTQYYSSGGGAGAGGGGGGGGGASVIQNNSEFNQWGAWSDQQQQQFRQANVGPNYAANQSQMKQNVVPRERQTSMASEEGDEEEPDFFSDMTPQFKRTKKVKFTNDALLWKVMSYH